MRGNQTLTTSLVDSGLMELDSGIYVGKWGLGPWGREPVELILGGSACVSSVLCAVYSVLFCTNTAAN